jgi:hypothetical protein
MVITRIRYRDRSKTGPRDEHGVLMRLAGQHVLAK